MFQYFWSCSEHAPGEDVGARYPALIATSYEAAEQTYQQWWSYALRRYGVKLYLCQDGKVLWPLEERI